jgi:hypothetical protein
MKLYTEETVKFIAKAIYEHDFDPNKTPEELVDELKPIELPSDEDIEEQSLEIPFRSSRIGFKKGAKWVIEQITKTK